MAELMRHRGNGTTQIGGNVDRRRPGRGVGRVVAAVAVGLLVAGVGLWSGSAPVARAAVARGSWQVQALGGGRWQVRWTSPTLLPLTSDRPEIVTVGTASAGPSVGVSTVAGDGRTVQAVVTSTSTPTPAGFDVVLSGVRLDEVTPPRTLAPRLEVPQQDRQQSTPSSVAPVEAGKFPVVSSDYTLPSVKLPGYKQPIEMVGHVVEPTPDAATGLRPLVLFLHGRHSVCYSPKGSSGDSSWPCKKPFLEIPSQLGYDYLQRSLASQGYTTVSIRVNGINAQDYAAADGGASARAAIVIKHLDYWADIAGAHRVDLSRVVLIGHSRGGEGVDTAALRIPLSAPYRVVGEVLIAPTDFAGRSAPYVPTVTVLPYCDGDVSDLQGQQYTDTDRDLADGDTALKSSVLVMGANHNFFNTEWTPGTAVAPANDDWYGDPKAACGTKTASRLTAEQQRHTAETYVDAAVRDFTAVPGTDRPDLALLDGSPTAAGDAVLSAAVGGGRDIRRPSADTSLSLASGADSSFCTGQADYQYQPGLCGSELADVTAPHWTINGDSAPTRTFWQVGWDAPGAVAGLQLKRPLDLQGRSLDLRTIVDPRRGDVQIRVRLTDSSGHTATLTPDTGATVPRLLTADGVTKLWARDVRVTPPAGGTLDLGSIVRVELLGDSSRGQVWVADLAATPAQAPAAQAERAATVSLGQLRQQEGNGPGTTIARVPFTVTGALTAPARFRVLTAGERPGTVRRFSIDLAPRQTGGSIPVGYQANTLDDLSPAITSITAWGQHNIVTDTNSGQLSVIDDDPTPKVTVTAVHATIKEGQTAQWRVTFAGPVDYDAFLQADVVAGSGRRVTGRDVPKTWLQQHGDASHPSKPLDQLHATVYGTIPTGSRSFTVSIPTLKDKVKEPVETLTVKIHALTTTKTVTVRIAASR